MFTPLLDIMKKYWLLAALFAVLVLAVRLYLAFLVSGLGDDSAYLHLRNAEHIIATGVPMFEDLLVSREGMLFSLFDYLLAAAGFFASLELAAKILPNIFAAVLVLIFFWLSLRAFRNPKAALFATVVLSTLPDFFASTFNSGSSLPLVFVFIAILHLLLLEISAKSAWVYVIVLALLALTHPSVVIFVLGVGIALLLKLSENARLSRQEIELALLSIFFTLTSMLFVYRSQLARFGFSLLYSSAPKELASALFVPLSILGAVASIGIVTILFILLIMYNTLFRERKGQMQYIIGMLAAASLLLWTGLVPADTGMLFFAFPAVLLFGAGYANFMAYMRNTRVADKAWIIHTCILVFALLTNLLQTAVMVQEQLAGAPDAAEGDAAAWISQYTPLNATVLTVPVRGEFVAYKTNRKVVLDSLYYFIPNAPLIYADVERVFTTSLEIEAASLMEKHGAEYIYAPWFVRQPKYVPGRCFSVAYTNRASVYRKSPICVVMRK